MKISSRLEKVHCNYQLQDLDDEVNQTICMEHIKALEETVHNKYRMFQKYCSHFCAVFIIEILTSMVLHAVRMENGFKRRSRSYPTGIRTGEKCVLQVCATASKVYLPFDFFFFCYFKSSRK